MISDCYSTWILQSIYTANKLAIARRFVKERGFDKRNVNLQAFPLNRRLRALASMGVFTETEICYCTLTQLVSGI